jgi:hypothetical protein
MNVYFHVQRLDKNVFYSLVGCSCITVDFGKLYIKMKTVAFMFSSFANCIFACNYHVYVELSYFSILFFPLTRDFLVT